MFKKILITCHKATIICDKNQYKEASFFEKIQLTLHLLICKICSLYVIQNKKMTAMFKIKSIDCKKETKNLSNIEKKALKKEIEKIII